MCTEGTREPWEVFEQEKDLIWKEPPRIVMGGIECRSFLGKAWKPKLRALSVLQVLFCFLPHETCCCYLIIQYY